MFKIGHLQARYQGFTLIELMVTLLVMAIVLGIGVPSFQNVVSANRLTTQANDFVSAMHIARSEAIKRNTSVKVVAVSGGTSWTQGWRVFVDFNNDGVMLDDGDALLCEVDSSNQPTEDCLIKTFSTITGSNTLVASTNNAFTYNNEGAVNSADTLDLCYQSGETGRRISLSVTGHTTVNSNYTCP